MDGKKSIFLAVLLCLLVLLANWLFFGQEQIPYQKPETQDLIIKVLDVGQADAILILAGKQAILVDSGDTKNSAKLVKMLQAEKITQLDLLVATHPHEDHIGGMKAVLTNFKVKKVLDSGQVHTTKVFRDYLSLVAEKDIPFIQARQGQKYDFDQEVSLEVLWPPEKLLQKTHSDLNNNSIVLRVEKERFSMLLTGDIEKQAEKLLLEQKAKKLPVTVLKAPHHGSKTSSSPNFLQKVAAKAVIISCGKDNDYGFPHEQSIKGYQENAMQVYITAEAGTVTIVTDGQNYEITTER